MDEHIFDQHPHRVRLEWGRRGVRAAVERGDIVVVVDALSFTSAVATAVAHGIDVYPLGEDDDAVAFARMKEAELAVRRDEVPGLGRFSLSPLTFTHDSPGARVVAASPNGATCARIARDAPYVFAASLLNAEAVAGAVRGILDETERCATIVACGERWGDGGDDGALGSAGALRNAGALRSAGALRFAVEDYVAAGAVISHLGADRSAEARAAEGAYGGVKDGLLELLLDCASGRELSARGYEDDVRFCARLDVYDCVPELRDERFAAFGATGLLAGLAR